MASAAGKPSGQPDEFRIRVPKLSQRKRYSVMKFNGSLGVDVTSWNDIKLKREDNRRVYADTTSEPTFGAGSEYGRKAREDARRKKLGLASKSYNESSQPWVLQDGRRSFKGMKEGGAGEHADYWIFVKAGHGLFDAIKIEDWYHFMPVATYKTLDIDQAEEEFLKRNKVLNQFALKAKIHTVEAEEDATSSSSSKLDTVKNLNKVKISDRDEYPSDSGDEDDLKDVKGVDDVPDSSKSNRTSSKKKTNKTRKKKEQKEEENTEDPLGDLESEDGEEEGREVDYISDSGSDTEPEVVEEDEKVEKELKGVGDESGLRDLLSDNDSDEDEEEQDELLKKAAAGEKTDTTDSKNNVFMDREKESDSDDSDSDDPDTKELKSAVFMTEKKVDTASSSSTSKRPHSRSEESNQGPSAKMSRVDNDEDGISEAKVRKYLERKPMSTKDLVAKLKPKCKDLTKQQLLVKLAEIMKDLNPRKEKKKVNGKDVLLFSL